MDPSSRPAGTRAPPPPGLAPKLAEILGFMAEHRLVETAHVERLQNVEAPVARARLRRLAAEGLARREQPFAGTATFHLINRRGLQALGSPLRPPRFDLGCYQHDVGLAWLWLAARSGAFGPLDGLVSERRMRWHDATRSALEPAMAVSLGGVGPGGRERLHYPDLLVVTRSGRRIAVELELSSKGRARRERILGGYAGDVRIGGVLYLVPNRPLARAIQESGRRMGIGHLLRIQMVSAHDPAAEARPARTAERSAQRVTAAGASR